MFTPGFLGEFKRKTEAAWGGASINPAVYGFQFQRGTRWNPGLRDAEIYEYEHLVGTTFPHDLKEFLKVMNGTNTPTLNVYAYCGEPLRHSLGVYSYPTDIERITQQIERARDVHEELSMTLADQGFSIPESAGFAPFYGIRYVLCTSDPDASVVLSIEDGSDAIVYGTSLQEYLEKEFLLQ